MTREAEKFDTRVGYLPGVGPKTGKKLAKLGVETIGDLIYFFPRKYLDYTDTISIGMINSQYSEINESSSPNLIKANSHQLEASSFTIKARITSIANKKTRRRGFTVTEAMVEDGTGALKVVWFNQPYLSKTLYAGREIILHGKVRWDYFNQTYSMESPDWAEKPKIVPIYRETEGVSSYYIGKIISNIKDQIAKIEDFLPDEIREENDLLSLDQAIRILHGPDTMPELERARERMAFDELFLISLRGQVLKQELKRDRAVAIKIEADELTELLQSLPYELTLDQQKAAVDILNDLSGKAFQHRKMAESSHKSAWLVKSEKQPESSFQPMNRLLNGDVGSGKTIVAALAAFATIKSGNSAMLMAPTEILAKQHFLLFEKLFQNYHIPVRLITSSQKKSEIRISKSKNNSKTQREKDEATIFIGTHALLYMEEKIDNLGLVIVDEQHRFGVAQRAKLRKLSMNNDQFLNNDRIDNSEIEELKGNCKLKINNSKVVPHFLSMTATPIPRSLQLALFAELDVSIIKEKPKNRKEIKTRVVDESNRQKAYEFIRAHVKAGRQAFVVCPLIEENSKSEALNANQFQNSNGTNEHNNETMKQCSSESLFELDRKTVLGEYEKLSKEVFCDLRIGMLHGRMKAGEKDDIMSQFSSRELDILVSTSVVEVGVDIPNATVMMIEDAERFGLAQLHQFRGRVGRGEHQSFCFLFSSSQSESSIRRLKKMEETNDGFKLAEFDLKNRGAGDIFGTDQSGFLDIKFADLSNAILISKASEAAKSLASQAADFSGYPALKEKLDEFNSSKHFE